MNVECPKFSLLPELPLYFCPCNPNPVSTRRTSILLRVFDTSLLLFPDFFPCAHCVKNSSESSCREMGLPLS